jgi:hypothetical protein
VNRVPCPQMMLLLSSGPKRTNSLLARSSLALDLTDSRGDDLDEHVSPLVGERQGVQVLRAEQFRERGGGGRADTSWQWCSPWRCGS